jgi:tetratricopeptide (TPR) repeat protein
MKRLVLALLALLLSAMAPAAAQGFCKTYFNSGRAASIRGNLDGAEFYLTRSLQCMKGNLSGQVPAHYARGMTRFTLGKYAEAAEDFALAMEHEMRWRRTSRHPIMADGRIHVGWVYVYRGLALLSAGDARGALADFEEAVDWYDTGDPLNPHIDLRFRQFNFALDDVFYAMPFDAAARYGRGLAKIRLGDTAGGNIDLDFATRINPEIRNRMQGFASPP